MPAAAVIPAPIVYANIAAVKTLVVDGRAVSVVLASLQCIVEYTTEALWNQGCVLRNRQTWLAQHGTGFSS